MIRFYLARNNDGAKMLVLGLSKAEADKLPAGDPVALEDFALPVQNIMFFGYKDRTHLAKLLRDTFKMDPKAVAMHVGEAYPS